jgi:hypothetical protein
MFEFELGDHVRVKNYITFWGGKVGRIENIVPSDLTGNKRIYVAIRKISGYIDHLIFYDIDLEPFNVTRI